MEESQSCVPEFVTASHCEASVTPVLIEVRDNSQNILVSFTSILVGAPGDGITITVAKKRCYDARKH